MTQKYSKPSFTPAFAESICRDQNNSSGQDYRSKSIQYIQQKKSEKRKNSSISSNKHSNKKRDPNLKSSHMPRKNSQKSQSQSSLKDISQKIKNPSVKKQKKCCNCEANEKKLIAKMKQLSQLRVDQKLHEVKTEFEKRFLKNEKIWKQRIDYHRDMLQKERAKM